MFIPIRTSLNWLLVFGFVTAPITGAYAGQCKGITEKRHSPQSFDFSTNSYTEQCDGSPYHCFHTCFENLMQEDIRLHWYVPDHLVWVPPGKTAIQTRYTSSYEQVLADKSCVEYGNNGRTVTAPLVARASEALDAKVEATEGCKRRYAQSSDRLQPFAGKSFKQSIRLFFPSDIARTRETMLVLDGSVALEVYGPTQFKTWLQYAITRYDGRPDGQAENLILVPRFRGRTEFLIEHFLRQYKDGFVPLASKDFVSFTVSDVKAFALDSASFEIVDKQKRAVASIYLPVIVPQPQ